MSGVIFDFQIFTVRKVHFSNGIFVSESGSIEIPAYILIVRTNTERVHNPLAKNSIERHEAISYAACVPAIVLPFKRTKVSTKKEKKKGEKTRCFSKKKI